MRPWDPLSERQVAVLRRIGGGDDLSGPEGVADRTSARSLQGRRLVELSRTGGSWRANLTDVGRFYFEHGHHPDHPGHGGRLKGRPAVVAGRSSGVAVARRTSSAVAGRGRGSTEAARQSAEELVERLKRDGTITVDEPDKATRAEYRRAIHAAKELGLVPEGRLLRHTGSNRGDLIIRLSEDSPAEATDWNRIRLRQARSTTDPSLVVAALEGDPAGLDVTDALIPRAIELVRLLAEEVTRRGYRLGVNTRTKHPKLFLRVGQDQRAVTVHEEYDEVQRALTAEHRRDPWNRYPRVDRVPSGRLRLEIGRAGGARDTWTDASGRPLERRVEQIARDVEAGAAADEAGRLEAKRRHEEYLAELEREEAAERRRWSAVLANARPQAVEVLRRSAFRQAYDAWVAAGEIRAFCDALEAGTADCQHGGPGEWVAWGRTAADHLDPTVGEDQLPDTSFDVEPGPNDLRPYLGGWHPTEPRLDYQWERDAQQLEAARQQASTWHHGMVGRRAWWR